MEQRSGESPHLIGHTEGKRNRDTLYSLQNPERTHNKGLKTTEKEGPLQTRSQNIKGSKGENPGNETIAKENCNQVAKSHTSLNRGAVRASVDFRASHRPGESLAPSR